MVHTNRVVDICKLVIHGLHMVHTNLIFSLEELEEDTNNFDISAFMGEGSHGQVYKGQLKDGSFVAIRCLKTKRSYTIQNFVHHIYRADFKTQASHFGLCSWTLL